MIKIRSLVYMFGCKRGGNWMLSFQGLVHSNGNGCKLSVEMDTSSVYLLSPLACMPCLATKTILFCKLLESGMIATKVFYLLTHNQGLCQLFDTPDSLVVEL